MTASPSIEVLQKIARNAGKKILSIIPSEGIKTKEGRGNFATAADFASEKEIIGSIEKYFPTHSVLSEETRSDIKDARSIEHLWIVDPIDGTNNFRYKRAYSAISIAYAHKGKVELAAVYDPYRDELFFAQKDRGSYLNDNIITVSVEKNIEQATIATDNCSNHQGTRKNLEILLSIPETPWSLLKGAAVLTLCEVASGRVDLYFHLALKPWDLAAALLIVEEAGGVAKTFTQQSAHFLEPTIVAGNSQVVEDFFKKANI